jgi:phenylacetate-coenzyme A ligase PaaK-like adenylate-forming protein
MTLNGLRLDFSEAFLKRRAFSEKPMTFIDAAPQTFLGVIIDLAAIETGNRAAREHWQRKQLENLLEHAGQRSGFWRERIGNKKIKDVRLSDLPILTRSDLVKQVETEGSLLRDEFEIRVTAVREIDWGADVKRLGFRSDLI